MTKYYQGWFKPRNPKKYVGNVTTIKYRSSWEKSVMSYFDRHPDIIQWMSEEVAIPYMSPLDGKIHKYYPDFVVKMKDLKKITKIIMIEVKPHYQTLPPKKGINKKRMINETKTYLVNQAKWEAASKYCNKRGWKFNTMTEKDIFGKK